MQLGQKYRSKIKMTTLNNSQFDTLVTKTMTSYMIGSMKVYQVSSFKHMSLVKLTHNSIILNLIFRIPTLVTSLPSKAHNPGQCLETIATIWSPMPSNEANNP